MPGKGGSSSEEIFSEYSHSCAVVLRPTLAYQSVLLVHVEHVFSAGRPDGAVSLQVDGSSEHVPVITYHLPRQDVF